MLRRWTRVLFSIRQAELDGIVAQEGQAIGDKRAAEWREGAKEDLELWRDIANSSEDARRKLLEKMILFESK